MSEIKNVNINFSIIKAAIIIIVSVVIYSNTITGEFVWDDRGSIVSNISIRDLKNIPLFFTTDSWKMTGNPSGSYYRPFINTWWTLEFQLWGEKPAGYHVTNIVLHTLISVLFYFLCLKISISEPASFYSALIFAAHPIHTENVAWITGVGYLVCALFIILSFFLYIRFRENNSIPFLIFSLLSFTLAAFSIEYTLMLPFMIILYEIQKYKRVNIKFLLPFFLISLFYIFIRQLIVMPGISSDVSIYNRFITSSVIIAKYIYTFLFPLDLKVLYDIQPLSSVFDIQVLFSIFILITVILLTVYSYKKEQRAFFATLWFFVILLPAANILVVIKPQMMSLRYLYIPSFGLAMLLGIYFDKLSPRLKFIPIIIIILFSIKAFTQNRYWQNEITLYGKMVSDAPASALARNNLGVAFLEASMPLKALPEFEQAVRLDPAYGFAFFNLGSTYQTLGIFDKAIFYLQKAIGINPSDSRAYNSLGVIYKKMGLYQESLYEFNRAIAANSRNYEAHYNLANLLFSMGQERDAVPHYIEFLRLAPSKYNAMKISIEKMLADRGIALQ